MNSISAKKSEINQERNNTATIPNLQESNEKSL